MIPGLVPVWKDLSINLWVMAALNPDLFIFFHFCGKSSCPYLTKRDFFFLKFIIFVCLQPVPPPLPSKTPPPPPPKTTRKQASIDSGIVQWTKTLTVGPNNTLTTQQKQHHPHPHPQKKQLFLPTHSLLPVPAWQDEYLTAAHPFLSSSFFFCPLSCFDFSIFVLKMMQSATGSMLHRWVVNEFIHAVHRATSRLYQDIVFRQISLDHQLSHTDPLSSTEEHIKE